MAQTPSKAVLEDTALQTLRGLLVALIINPCLKGAAFWITAGGRFPRLAVREVS